MGWTVGWTAAGFSLFRNKFRLTRAKQAHPPSANYSPPVPNFGDVMIERKQGENTGAFYRDGAAEQRTQQEKLRRHRRAPHTPRRKACRTAGWRWAATVGPLVPPITQKRLGRWVEGGGSAGIACHHQRVDATRNSHNVMDEDLPDGAVQMRSDVSRTA